MAAYRERFLAYDSGAVGEAMITLPDGDRIHPARPADDLAALLGTGRALRAVRPAGRLEESTFIRQVWQGRRLTAPRPAG